MTERKDETTVPTKWLGQVAELLWAMAGEGVGMSGRAEPEDLLSELADHLGLQDSEDPWTEAVVRLGGYVGERDVES